MTQAITALAAVAAAIFSFRNIFISNRLAQSGELQKWRRDTVLKTIVDFVHTTEEMAEPFLQWDMDGGGEASLKDLKVEAKTQLFELSLVASQECVKAGQILLNNLGDAKEYYLARKRFIAACRADLGID